MELEASRVPTRAAEYLRKSTDYQEHSIAIQSAANHAYAAVHRMEIVRTYVDEGRSGLSLDGRDALKQLIEDVQSGGADFTAILVYDVSRWGRFQDADESGYYEYICKRAGIHVHYCVEQFENDGSPIAAIVKSIKRAMAGEYSRELSVKVFAGQRRAIEKGYRLGGHAGYGLRRVLIGQDGVTKCVLAPGEWKSISTDRVVLAPGPEMETEVVRSMYSMFAEAKKTEREIADILNDRGILNHVGSPWKVDTVRHVLQSEKYIGNHVWNRKSFKLRKKIVRNKPEFWVRSEGALQPIVERRLFDAAQRVYQGRIHRTYRGRPRGLSNDEMLERLARVFLENGKLSRRIVDSSGNAPSCWAYKVRFGGIAQAYALVGFSKDANQYGPGLRIREHHKDPRGLRNEDMLEALRQLLQNRGYLSGRIIDARKDVPCSHAFRRHFGSLLRAYELIGYTRPYRTRPSLTNEGMLTALKRLLQDRGDLSRKIINQTDSLPSAASYAHHFSGLLAAYRLIGFKPSRLKLFTAARGITNEKMLEKLACLLRDRGYLTQDLIDQTEGMPSGSLYYNRFGSLRRAYQLIGYVPRQQRNP